MVLFGFGGFSNSARTVKRNVASAAVSEQGLVRLENQDHVLVDDLRYVYCVADGVGGGSEGARASEMVCRNIKMFLNECGTGFAARVAAVDKAVAEANSAIYSTARECGYKSMGSTVAVLVLDPANTRHVAVCHVGDSRVYRIRGGMPSTLTRDHRVAGSHGITRAVGMAPTVEPEWVEIESTSPSRFLLCTDGVHDVVSDPRLAAFVAAGAVDSAASRLSAEVVRCGAPDNYSFVIVSV
jgi:serine/threonine protein phosphatase PrpC